MIKWATLHSYNLTYTRNSLAGLNDGKLYSPADPKSAGEPSEIELLTFSLPV